MEWSKLKNIILLILLCTNAALLAMVLGQNWRESSALRQARADAIALLRQEGTQVEDDVVPQKTELTLLRAERDQAEEEKLARALLGDELAAQDRGGGVYLYRSDLGEIQFHSDGAFQTSFQPNAFSLNGEGPEQLAQRIAEQLAFTGQVVQAQTQSGGSSVLLRQLWNGVPVFNLQMTLEFSSAGLTGIGAGRRLFGTPQRQAAAVLSPASALVRFSAGMNALGDVCSSIDDIQPGYLSSATLTDGMILTPVWYITTDTGGYCLDLVSGSLSRA